MLQLGSFGLCLQHPFPGDGENECARLPDWSDILRGKAYFIFSLLGSYPQGFGPEFLAFMLTHKCIYEDILVYYPLILVV